MEISAHTANRLQERMAVAEVQSLWLLICKAVLDFLCRFSMAVPGDRALEDQVIIKKECLTYMECFKVCGKPELRCRQGILGLNPNPKEVIHDAQKPLAVSKSLVTHRPKGKAVTSKFLCSVAMEEFEGFPGNCLNCQHGFSASIFLLYRLRFLKNCRLTRQSITAKAH